MVETKITRPFLGSAVHQHLLAVRAVNGLIARSEVGRFIAENLRRDPKSEVTGAYVAGLLARDLGALVTAAVPAPLARLFGAEEKRSDSSRELAMNITKLTGEN